MQNAFGSRYSAVFVVLVAVGVLSGCRTEKPGGESLAEREGGPVPAASPEETPPEPVADPEAGPIVPIDFRSSLPVIAIDAGGAPILDEPKSEAKMYVHEPPDGKPEWKAKPHAIGIELRGSSSLVMDKKSFGFEFRDGDGKDVDRALLGLPAGSDWVLYGSAKDDLMLSNAFAYGLSREIGRYAPRTRFVELFVRDGGPDGGDNYRGVYALTERIDRGEGRLRIAEQKGGETNPELMSGGWVVRIDKLSPRDVLVGGRKLRQQVTVRYPKGKTLSRVQKSWLGDYLTGFEESIETGAYGQHIDVASFVDHSILNELTRNYDAYCSSTYLHKDRGGKLVAGPLWDMDNAMGNGNPSAGVAVDGWLTRGKTNRNSRWWNRLFNDATFVKAFTARWKKLRGEQLSDRAMARLVDGLAAPLAEPWARDGDRWGKNKSTRGDTPYLERVDNLKDWLARRAAWIDTNLGELKSPVEL